jgi:hypothetical protein
LATYRVAGAASRAFWNSNPTLRQKSRTFSRTHNQKRSRSIISAGCGHKDHFFVKTQEFD